MSKSELEELDDDFGPRDKTYITDPRKGMGKNCNKQQREKMRRARQLKIYIDKIRKENELS